MDPTRKFIWKDYVQVYADFIEALRGDDSYRYDIREGAGPDAKIKKGQKIADGIKKKMSPKAMMKLQYNVLEFTGHKKRVQAHWTHTLTCAKDRIIGGGGLVNEKPIIF
jgi:hypothetical protein